MSYRVCLGFIAALVFSISACKGKSTSQAVESGRVIEAEPLGLDDGHQWLYESGKKHLESVEKEIGTAKFEPTYECISVMQAVREFSDHDHPELKAFVAKGEKACGIEAWVAVANHNIAAIEAGKKAKPKDPFITECVNIKTALENVLDKFKADPRLPAIADKHTAYCNN